MLPFSRIRTSDFYGSKLNLLTVYMESLEEKIGPQTVRIASQFPIPPSPQHMFSDSRQFHGRVSQFHPLGITMNAAHRSWFVRTPLTKEVYDTTA